MATSILNPWSDNEQSSETHINRTQKNAIFIVSESDLSEIQKHNYGNCMFPLQPGPEKSTENDVYIEDDALKIEQTENYFDNICVYDEDVPEIKMEELDIPFTDFQDSTKCDEEETLIAKEENDAPDISEPQNIYVFKCAVCPSQHEETHDPETTKPHFEKEVKIIKTETNIDEENKYACIVCGGNFKRYSALKTHSLLLHYHDKITLSSNKTISNRTVKNKRFKPHPCKVCNGWFNHYGNLKRDAVVKSTLQCRHCPKKCLSYVHFELHVLTHGYYACLYCETELTNKTIFLGHLKTHKVGDRFPCKLCDKPLNKYHDLKSHLDEHRFNNVDNFKCKPCDKSFKSMKSFKEHMMRKIQVVCGVCNKRVLHYNLEVHKELHKKAECWYCGFVCPRNSNLCSHIRRHMARINFDCTKCDKVFLEKRTLKIHCENSH